jgi:hypothetical protein
MVLALAVLVITMLLTAALFTAVQGDAPLTRNDLNGKRAYSAAQAGVQQYLYQINANSANSAWWETCSNDTLARTAVPGTTTGSQYSYTPVLGNGACTTSNAVATLIDPTTGSLRIRFTGYSGNATKTIVASLRTLSPLSFLWYTVHETEDYALGDSTCQRFHYQSPGPNSDCDINWVTGDTMNGPLYTQDQLVIYPGASPSFGRPGTTDKTISGQAVSSSVCASSCQNATFANTPVTNPSPQVQLPSDNSNLVTDATKYGVSYSGTTTLTLNGTSATGWNCPSTSSRGGCTAVSIPDLTKTPIIYATNAAGCNSSYDPTNVSYPVTSGNFPSSSPLNGNAYGPCGDIYVQGTYTTPLTIASADDIIVADNLQTTEDSSGNPTGSATLGLVADQYVRVQHDCTGNPAVTIDAAILTLAHSFFVDNFDCGGSRLGQLTVHGAIAQQYRGIVGQVGSSGYLKNYNYDDRLAVILPPYLFDLQNTQWTAFRETLCDGSAASSGSTSCTYNGS